MTALDPIFRMRLATLRNRARNLGKDSLPKALVVFFGLGIVIGIGFFGSYYSFRFIERFPAFGPALNAKMVSLLFFALLILVMLSTIIVTYTTIFLARETEYFFQHPIPPRTIFFFKLTEAIAFSSWATLFLCLPVLVSFGFLRNAPAVYYLETCGVISIFLLFAGFTGAALAIVLAPIMKRLSMRQMIISGGLFLVILAWIFLYYFNLRDMDGENNLLILDRFTSEISAMHSPFFPSQWASSAVLAAAAGNHPEVLFQTATLLANTLIFIPFLAWYGTRHYGLQWASVRGAASGATSAATLGRARHHGARLLRPLGALTRKDLLVFLRDPAQVSQSILFLVLMVIYSLSLLKIPPSTGPPLQHIIYFANLGAVCSILSAFTSRFLFPLMSLEGKAFWIVGLAPLSRTSLLRQKAYFGLGVSLVLGLPLIVVSNGVLQSPPHLFATAIYTMVLSAVCLTSLSTGLGAAYPVPGEDNPARIAVGMGGTLNFFASAVAVALIIFIEATPYLRIGQRPGSWVYAAHFLALAFTAAVSAFAFRLGARAIQRSEF